MPSNPLPPEFPPSLSNPPRFTDFDVFNLDDVDTAFSRVTPLRFQQELRLQGRGEGMAITPLAAGHLLGGTVWRVVGRDGEEHVYAVDFNHRWVPQVELARQLDVDGACVWGGLQ